MATDEKKPIDEDTKLRAFALFVMASQHHAECRRFEAQMSKLLGYPEDDGPYMGCLSDEIYNDNGSFERGLKNEGFVLETGK